MNRILDGLLTRHNRASTNRNYLSIWRTFNNFLIKLDVKPPTWEEWVALFLAYQVQNGSQSSTIKSYTSAIKSVLKNDGYQWNDSKILLSSLTKSCKLKNDKLYTRLPITFKLLELLLFEVCRLFNKQWYLEVMYKAMLVLGYFGLLRIGKMAASEHVMKAANVHIGTNKDKIMIVVYSSKTHDASMRPQKIKITGVAGKTGLLQYFCPFKLARQYMNLRGNYDTKTDPSFVFSDGKSVMPQHFRAVLKKLISALGLEEDLYNVQSLHIGRASDMVHRLGYSVQEAKFAGRWKSNAVYKYIRINWSNYSKLLFSRISRSLWLSMDLGWRVHCCHCEWISATIRMQQRWV